MSIRGFVLLPVLAFIVVIALLAYGASRSGPAAVAQLARAEETAEVRYAAEAGFAHGVWMTGQSDCGTYDDLASTTFGGASYDVVFSASSGSPVTVTATSHSASGASTTLVRSIDVYQLPVSTEDQPGSDNADTAISTNGGSVGSSKKLEVVNKSGEESRVLLQIDLGILPSGARVVSATLELYVETSDVQSGAEVTLHRLTRAWSEAQASWHNYDVVLVLGQPWSTAGGDFDATPVFRLPLDTSEGVKALDVTTAVQDWMDGNAPNHGLILKANPAVKKFEIYSSDDDTATRRPKLRVEYVCRCGSVCAPVFVEGNALTISTLHDATLAGQAFEDGDIVGHDPVTMATRIRLREDDVFDADEDIDALHVYADDRLVLSTDASANLAGLAVQDEDLVEYNPKVHTATRIFDGSTHFAGDEDVDAVHVYDDGRIVLSTDTAASLAGVAFEDEDVVEYNPTANLTTLVFDGSARFAADENVDGLQILADGRLLVSTDSDASLGGLSFTDADIVLYDPLENVAALAYDGAGITSAPDADIDALHDFRPYPLVDQLRLEPVADTYLSQSQPNAAFGSAQGLRVSNAWRTLVRFDLSALPVGATVTAAALYLNLDSGGAALLTGAYQVTADWAEGTATWNSTGGGSFAALPAATATFSATPAAWTRWVLPPALIHEWRDGVSPNYGLLLKPTLVAVGQTISRSRNYSSTAVHPRLVLKYSLP